MAAVAEGLLLESRFTRLLMGDGIAFALWRRLLLALAVFLVALLLRFAALPAGAGYPFFTFYPAILAAALILGLGPGLLVAILSASAAFLFFLPSVHTFAIARGALAPLTIFVFCSTLTCVVAHFTRRTIQALGAARWKLLRLQEAVPVGLVLSDMNGRFLEFNPAFASLTGYTAEELRTLDYWTLTPERYAEEQARQISILTSTGRFGPFEKEYIRKDGTTVPVQVTGTLLERADGTRGTWSVVEDITQRRRAQEGFEQLMREQKAILDSRVIGIIRAKNRHIVWTNEQFAEMLGYTPGELIGQPARIFYPSDEAYADFAATAFPLIRTGKVFKAELPQRRKSGEIVWFEVTSARLGEDEQIATFVDVTERRRIAAELQQAKADLQAILDHIPARITSWNRDGTNCFANRFAESRFGIEPGSATGRHVRDIIGEQRFQQTRDRIEAVFAGITQSYETMEMLSDGSPRFSHVTAVPKVMDGQVVGSYVLATDVTELHNAQQTLRIKLEELQRSDAALRESEHRLRTITDNLPITVALYDSEHRIQFANREYRRLGVNTDREPTGVPAADYLTEPLNKRSFEFRVRALRGEVVRFTSTHLLGGSLRQREVTYLPYRDATGAVVGVYAMGYDVTELRESHARIRELAERLASVREDERRAVAVKLHEGVGQELYAAHLSLRALEREGRGRSSVRQLASELAQVIDRSIEDVRNLTNDLYPTALTHLPLLSALQHLATQFGHHARIQVTVRQTPEFPELRPEIRVLFFRAAQEALTNVGRHAAASSVSISLEADVERVAMLVADDGKGIAGPDLQKAGSLGLLGIRERFAAAGGSLLIERTQPSGTCLTVFVPTSASDLTQGSLGIMPHEPAEALTITSALGAT